MTIGYEGTTQLWEKVYTTGGKNGDLIERELKKLTHIKLKTGELTFNKKNTLTIIKISEAPVYNGQEPTNSYRRLVRIKSTGQKIPKGITEILEKELFEQLV